MGGSEAPRMHREYDCTSYGDDVIQYGNSVLQGQAPETMDLREYLRYTSQESFWHHRESSSMIWSSCSCSE
jgi:hypothetical protein